MNLVQYNNLISQYETLSIKVDEAKELADVTDDYSEFESLEQNLFELELRIPRMKPLN